MTEGCWDAVVVGGGPSGCLCAILLARAGHRVLIAEAAQNPQARLAETLGPAAVRRLQPWVAFETLPQDVVTRCRGVLVNWGEGDARVTDYELQCGGPAWTVQRPAFERLLLRQAAAAGADTRLGWRCVRIASDPGSDHADVLFTTPAGPSRAAARCVVQATGRVAASPVSRRWYYDRQLAFSTVIHDPVALHDLLWVESTHPGWWYLCAMPGGGAQLVWITQTRPSSSDTRSRQTFFSSGFARTRMIRSAFNSTPEFESISVCDARLSHSSFDDHGTMFRIGDASATSDPLSGRGWELALASASSASEAIGRYLRAGDATAMMALQAARARTFHVHAAERTSLWLAGGQLS